MTDDKKTGTEYLVEEKLERHGINTGGRVSDIRIVRYPSRILGIQKNPESGKNKNPVHEQTSKLLCKLNLLFMQFCVWYVLLMKTKNLVRLYSVVVVG